MQIFNTKPRRWDFILQVVGSHSRASKRRVIWINFYLESSLWLQDEGEADEVGRKGHTESEEFCQLAILLFHVNENENLPESGIRWLQYEIGNRFQNKLEMRLNGPGNWLDVVGKEQDSMITPIQEDQGDGVAFYKVMQYGEKKESGRQNYKFFQEEPVKQYFYNVQVEMCRKKLDCLGKNWGCRNTFFSHMHIWVRFHLKQDRMASKETKI